MNKTLTDQSLLSGLEEDVRIDGAEQQLSAVSHQRRLSSTVEAAPVAPHQVGRVAHACEQRRPHRTAQPFWRDERWLVQNLQLFMIVSMF